MGCVDGAWGSSGGASQCRWQTVQFSNQELPKIDEKLFGWSWVALMGSWLVLDCSGMVLGASWPILGRT